MMIFELMSNRLSLLCDIYHFHPLLVLRVYYSEPSLQQTAFVPKGVAIKTNLLLLKKYLISRTICKKGLVLFFHYRKYVLDIC